MYFNKIIKDGYNLSIIWIVCTLLLINNYNNIYVIVPLCVGTIVSLILLIIEDKLKNVRYINQIFTVLVVISIVTCKFISNRIDIYTITQKYIFYIPLFIYILNMYYNISIEKDVSLNTKYDLNKGSITLNLFSYAILSISVCILHGFGIEYLILVSISLLSFILSNREKEYYDITDKYNQLYSNSDLEKNLLNEKIKIQINNENNLIENAILNERNRISRDIHDSLGHLTSRGILQIGSMMVTEKDENKIENLRMLKDTLSEGMAEVRKSLHNFQNESINIEIEVEKIINNFTFCDISKNISISDNISLNHKYTILYIIKESLTNVIKHSNATNVDITISEISNNIYLNISDNGNSIDSSEVGIGIHSIKQRIYELNGKIDIFTSNGYKLFITLPK